MKTEQYDRFLKKNSIKTRYESDLQPRNVIVSPNKGKHAGAKLRLIAIDGSRIQVEVSETKSVWFPYSQIDELDANLQPIIEPVLDMTGRDIDIGDYVCYSQAAGNSSHCLNIGQIRSITPTGGLKVFKIIRDGEKIKPGAWYGGEHTLGDPSRVLKIPIDTQVVTMWILTDFDEATRNRNSGIAF